METSAKLVGFTIGFVVSILIVVVICVIFAFPTMWLWNALVPEIFSLPKINLWQALGLTLLSNLLFNNTSPSSASHSKKKS